VGTAGSASSHDVALLRLAAQRLVGPPPETAGEAVRWLTAVQGQDLPGALLSVALRTRRRSRADVEAALGSGDVVRTWPMRGTLHLVAAEDAGWLLRLLAPRVVVRSAGRRASLGLTEDDAARAREVSAQVLGGGARLTRPELLAAWQAAGVETGGQRGAHLLSLTAMGGTIVQGPLRDGQQLYVLTDGWVQAPRRLEGDEALGELALRYLRSHGPATALDLRRWAGLLAGEARTAIALARPQLLAIDVGGVEHLMDPGTPDRLAAARESADGVLLLPGFDELVLGYADRSASLDPRFADRICPGSNGMFRPTVVSGGQVVGTWARCGRGGREITATPFTSFTADVEAAVPLAHAALP
jgi:hypothetical protein